MNRKHIPNIVFTILLACFCMMSCKQKARPVSKVILISIDTLRADFLGSYNPSVRSTPNIDQFARENILFEDALAQGSNTAISHKSIFYSVYPRVHKTTIDSVPDESVKSPVETLRENGFRTAAFVGGGQLRPAFGFNKGFEQYEIGGLKRMEKDAMKWLDENHKSDFFLFLHTYQVHCPYNPPPRLLKKLLASYRGKIDPAKTCELNGAYVDLSQDDIEFLKSLYAAEVTLIDEFLGRLISKLKALGLYENILIVLLSDHGESLGEQGFVGHNLLTNVQLRIPLIVRAPGFAPARIAAPVESIDVMPSVFELAQLNPPYAFQGKSFLHMPRQESNSDHGDRVRFAEVWNASYVRKGPFSLQFWRDDETPPRLFHVLNDPLELSDLAENHPDVVQAMKAAYKRRLTAERELSAKFSVSSKRPQIDEETEENLKALGYIQ